MSKPKNRIEALSLVIALTIVAPTESKRVEIAQMAEALAAKMPEADVEQAKYRALLMVEAELNVN
jgi:hypothetical protein